jgi:hypothetical protein
MGELEALFEAIDIDAVQDYVTSRQQEHLHLDFKLVNDPSMKRDDRKSFAVALSGFANSDGGIIIWGVRAAKDPATGIDCATDLVPIADIALFLSRLNSLTGEVVAPTVSGVEHEGIDRGDGTGFVKSIVPASETGPHMARAGEGRYFKRSGDSFYRMEHFDVADMFGRRKHPKLRLATRISRGGTRSRGTIRQFDLLVYLTIVNEGRGSARAPFLSIDVSPPFSVYAYGVDGNMNFGLPVLQRSRGTSSHLYGASSDFVIHPGTGLDVTAVTAEIVEPDDGPPQVPDLLLTYVIAAEEADTVNESLEINSEDIIRELGSA